MKITSIQIKNFQGARDIALHLTAPVNLICGANAAGKSSIVDALRLALLHDPVRVDAKKDYAKLVTAGAKYGSIDVGIDGMHTASIMLPSGKTDTGGFTFPAALRQCLVAQSFARMGANERRQFLFGLSGLSASGEEFKKRLLSKGLDADLIEKIMPLLRTSAEEAGKNAAGYARDGKARWKTLTGETWGPEKSAHWRAKKPLYDAAAFDSECQRLADADKALAQANRDFGALDGARRAAAAHADRMAQLKSQADHRPRILAKLEVDEKQAAEWVARVEQARIDAGEGSAPQPKHWACPCCAVLLQHRAADGALIEYESSAEQSKHDPDAAARLTEYEAALKLSQSAVANDKRDLSEAEKASAALEEIQKMALAPTPAEIETARQRVFNLQGTVNSASANVTAARHNKTLAESADRTTADAQGAHDLIMAWLAIADALAPGGVQAEMLSEALAPINARMAQSASEAQWPVAVIDADMQITAGGRAYALLSESEQWRTDAMIAEAISHLSGVRLLVLDRLDVLDIAGRGDLIEWLDCLADAGQFDTALIFGTLKAQPTALPANFVSHWIKAGVIDGLPEMRKAA